MFKDFENMFIVEEGDRGPVVNRTFARTEDELEGMNQDPYPVKVWNASGQVAHLPTRHGSSLDVSPNCSIKDFDQLDSDQLEELEWGVVIIDNNSEWAHVKDQVKPLVDNSAIVFLNPDGTEAEIIQ